jgi:transcription elongation factor GreB
LSGNEKLSRGFVKEDDLEHAGTDLPERPISDLPNYVTPHGFSLLEQAAEKLDGERLLFIGREDDSSKQKLAVIDRDLRYISAKLESAIVVDHTLQTNDSVLFSATVDVEDEEGKIHQFTIVGEDEADIAENKVSWASPLAKALIGHKVGESVIWKRPAGNLSLEIIKIA